MIKKKSKNKKTEKPKNSLVNTLNDLKQYDNSLDNEN